MINDEQTALICRRLLETKDRVEWDLVIDTISSSDYSELKARELIEEGYENEYELTEKGKRAAIDHQKVIDYFRNILETDYSIDTRKYNWCLFIPDFVTWFNCEVTGTHKTTGARITLTDVWITATGEVLQCGSGELRL